MDYGDLYNVTNNWSEPGVETLTVRIYGYGDNIDPFGLGWVDGYNNGYVGLEVVNHTTGVKGLIFTWVMDNSGEFIRVQVLTPILHPDASAVYFYFGDIITIDLSSNGVTAPDLSTHLTKIDNNGFEIVRTHTIVGIESSKWRGIANGYNRGRSVNIEVKNANEIKSIMYDLNIESEVNT